MQIPDQYKFIIQLGKALHNYGVPSYKIQTYLHDIAAKKNIKGSFMDTPTWINYVFYEKDYQTYNYVDKMSTGMINLGALSKIVEITNHVLSNKLTFAEAKTEIKSIGQKQISYGWFTEMLAFMFSAGAFSIILDAGWTSALVAFIIGSIIYGLTVWAGRSKYIQSILETLVAFTATIIIGLLSLRFDQLNISMTILASIIVFIPGLSITTALEELTSNSLLSGTAKLFGALVSLFKQFFGVALGLAMLSFFVELQPHNIVDMVPSWVDFIAVLLLATSLTPVFKVRLKDFAFCILSGLISFYTVILFEPVGLLISIFFGTIAAVVISKLFSKITKSPELVYLVPGTIMLVPGSKAFIGLSSMFSIAETSQSNMGLQIAYIFMGIIGGLIFSGSFIQNFANE